jgi:hypothetical protein
VPGKTTQKEIRFVASEIEIDRGLVAVAAVMRADVEGAAVALADMTPEALHDLMRVCLVTAGLARESMLGPMEDSDTAADRTVRSAHRVVDELERG